MVETQFIEAEIPQPFDSPSSASADTMSESKPKFQILFFFFLNIFSFFVNFQKTEIATKNVKGTASTTLNLGLLTEQSATEPVTINEQDEVHTEVHTEVHGQAHAETHADVHAEEKITAIKGGSFSVTEVNTS